MKFRIYIYILMAVIIAIAGFDTIESQAAKKRTKAGTTQTSSRKSKKKRKTKRKKRKSRKKRYTRRVTKPTAPKPEQPSNDSLTLAVNERLLQWIPEKLNPGGLRVNSVKPDRMSKIARLSLNENFTYLPVTRELIDSLAFHAKAALPDSISDYNVTLNVGTKSLAYFITKVDKLPEKFRKNPPLCSRSESFCPRRQGTGERHNSPVAFSRTIFQTRVRSLDLAASLPFPVGRRHLYDELCTPIFSADA